MGIGSRKTFLRPYRTASTSSPYANAAADLFPQARIARGVVPYRGASIDLGLLWRRGGGSSGVDPVRLDLRRSADLQPAHSMCWLRMAFFAPTVCLRRRAKLT